MLRVIIVLLFVFICIDNIYSHPYPDRFNSRNQQDVIKNKEASLPVISLKEGNAFIKGKVYGYNPVSNSRVRIAYHNPIMNKTEAFVVEISENGDFFVDVPILSNSTCLFVSDYYKEYILLSPSDTCYIHIDSDKIRKVNEFNAIKRDNIDNQYVRFDGSFAEVNNELNNLHFWSNSINLFSYKNEYTTLAQYKTYILSTLEKSLKELLNTNISKQTKELITINLQQQAIRCLLDDRILLENLLDKGNLSTPAADISYFSFLEEMNINSLYSFYGRFFSNIIDECRRIEDMVMPLRELINKRQMPQKALVNEDIVKQKGYLARILKKSSGPAFDLLEVLNFTLKIEQDLTLDEWEIENLRQLKEPVYYNYVIRKNELLSSHLENIRKKSASVIFDATTEKKDNFFEDILSLYEGNIIMVNYWSMGCLGALNAIKDIEPLKMKYKNRKVVFIYLTDDHFLYPIWENKATQIEGVHYRLNKKQLNFIISKYKMMDVTPSFLVFDKKGECIFNQKGYSKNAIKNIFDTIDKGL
ncbi:MAG: hypothetical protein AB2L24_11070 [Mangrovibacterium sp.]